MKRVGILGGTFDPPHLGHLIIANEVLASFSLDEIWFMPNGVPPHKEKTRAISDEERVHLLQLAICDHPQFRLEKIELQRQGPSYTVDTMQVLTSIHPENEFYFIIGADMIEYLPKWRGIDQLLKLVTFIGVGRPSYEQSSPYPLLYANVPQMEISSSLIRSRLQNGDTIRYLVPDKVRDYMREKGLYGS